MDGCWGGFLPCLLYYSISSGTLVDLTKLHDWHFINIYLKNILCIFVSLLAPFPPSLWLFPVQKKKNVATNFCSLNSFHPTTKCKSCSLSYPKKIILFLYSSTYWCITSFSSLSDFKKVVCSTYLHCFFTH